MNIGISGLGRTGRFHHECLRIHHPETIISSIWDPSANSAAEGEISISNSWEDFLNQQEIETVFLCGPTQVHFEQLKELLSAGKTVFVEHPICFTLQEAKEINQFSDDQKSMLNLLPNQFDQIDFHFASGLVKEKSFGNCNYAEISSCGSQLIGQQNQSEQLFEIASLYTDQFLQFVSHSPDSVFASTTENPTEVFPVQHIELTFFCNSQNVGRIQIDRDAIVPQKPLWKLEGDHGGYFDEKLYLKTEEEEIFPQPASRIIPVPGNGKIDYFEKKSTGQQQEELNRALFAVAILEAARESLTKQKVIPIFQFD